VLLIKLPSLESNQYAAFAVWPEDKIEPLSFIATPIVLPLKLVAILFSSLNVVVSNLDGDFLPLLVELPIVL